MSLRNGIRPLSDRYAKLNMIRSHDLEGSAYAVVKNNCLYISPALYYLMKSENPKTKSEILKSLRVFDSNSSVPVMIICKALVKLTKVERILAH